MILFLLAYLGGVLTIVSPCILPVLPFVFARPDRPFLQSGLPLLAGMAVSFAGVATLAAVGGGWAVEANNIGRGVAIGLLALFGLALVFPALSDWMTRPVVALGARLSRSADGGPATGKSAILSSLLLGAATGLLWAPCAGPVLGLILTGAALQGANVQTSLLLIAYAAGAATSLALALLIGGRIFATMKRSLGVSEWLRRGLGIAVLGAVTAIALGLDTGVLTRLSTASTTSLEQNLLDTFHASNAQPANAMTGGSMTSANPAMMAKTSARLPKLAVEGTMPSLAGAVEWLNSPPLTTEGLKGKVVLVDFWTYSCVNCLRTLPYTRAWAEKYKDQGLVVIGVHTPEFAFEKNVANVRMAVSDLKIGYPVAVDNDYAIWRAFNNQYWPAHYFIDAQGRVRHHQFGEGDYDVSEKVIQTLLAEAGKPNVNPDLVKVNTTGAAMAAGMSDLGSPETYIGYARAENFASPDGMVRDAPHTFEKGPLRLNEWALSGGWTVGDEDASLDQPNGEIAYKFRARDLNLVMGPGPDGKPVRYRVTIDGAAPGESHGTDVDAEGQGVVTSQRLYQIVRQKGPIDNRTFEIRFLDPGVQAFAFTFG